MVREIVFMSNDEFFCAISILNIFLLISQSDIVSINKLTLMLQNYWSVRRQTHCDVDNEIYNAGFEGLDIHYQLSDLLQY
jgi:hypothetical protein